MREQDYFFTLDELDFNQKYLAEMVKTEIPKEDWYIFDCGKVRWTVQEEYETLRSECTSFNRSAWFEELYSLFKLPINYGDVLFTRTPPPGIPPHIDRNRSVAINLPVTGVFSNSPIIWYDDFNIDTEVCRFSHSRLSKITGKPTALLFNPKKIHGVINNNDLNRCLLTIWWRDVHYSDFLSGWKDGSIINWKALENNKYIKLKKGFEE